MKVRELFEENIRGNIAVYATRVDQADTIFPETYKNYYLHSDQTLPFDYSNDPLQGSLLIKGSNQLTSFKGVPKIVKGKYQVYTSLQKVDCSPETVHCLDFHDCGITTLQGMPKEIINGHTRYDAFANFGGCDGLESLEGIGKDYLLRIDSQMILPRTIKSHMLGLLKVKNLESVYTANATGEFLDAIGIINKYLKSNGNIRKCKSELEEAGLNEYAKL